jgi:hypothetical protein
MIDNRRPAAQPPRHSLVLVALSATVLGMPAPSAGASARVGPPRGVVARTLSATDTAHLRYNERASEGEVLYEEGSATGSLPGHMRARLKLGVAFSGSFTFYTQHGSIKGRGTATPSRSAGKYESFRGSLIAIGGSGAYAHVHGRAGLYGIYNRETYAVTVQTTGKLSY